MGLVVRAADLHTNAIFNVTFSLSGHAQNRFSIPDIPIFTLVTNWAIAPSNGPGSLITPDGANQRTIAYNARSNHLYLVSRSSPVESNYVVYALHAQTGTNVFTLNTSGLYNGGAVGEGGIGLASMAVAEDGAIYACNMSVDACSCGPNAGNAADSLFRVYRWADGNSNTAPTEIFAGDPAGSGTPLRWGDTLAVRGSGTNTQILLDSSDGTHVALLTPVDAALNTFTSTSFTNSKIPLPGVGRMLQLAGTNTFLRKAKGTDLQLVKWDAAKHTFSVSASSHLPTTLGPLGTNGLGLGAAIDFNGGATNADAIKLYDLSNFSAPGLLDQQTFPTNQQSNPEFAGKVIFSGGDIWALDANNGLVALSMNGPHEVTFLTAQPGHIGNRQIIQALGRSLHSNSVSGARLIVKTDELGTDHFKSKFRLRIGTNDVDVSNMMPFDEPLLAIVSAESTNPSSTATNAIDYTVTHLSLIASGLSFDVEGLGIWKSSPVVYRGQTIMDAPFPNSIMLSALDGIGASESQSMTFHGSAAITGRKIEVAPNEPPTVTLTSPSNGSSFAVGANVVLRASALDDDGSVSRVEFYQDGNKVGETTSSSSIFTFSWTNAPAGGFGVYAKAIDDDGASGLSGTNAITVNPVP